jgi:hypothetical protein
VEIVSASNRISLDPGRVIKTPTISAISATFEQTKNLVEALRH